MDEEKKQIFNLIHKSLHDTSVKTVNINGVPYPITLAKNSCRLVKYDKKIFIQQDPKKKTKLSLRVKNGENITRIIRSGKRWGWISDGAIYDPLKGE